MNFEQDLYNMLDYDEWRLCGYYIKKAWDYYEAEKYDYARESLEDAIAICLSNQEFNAANKISKYLRFC